MSSPQALRLHKISELKTFLISEVEAHGYLHKKYRRFVNVIDCVCAALAGVSLGMSVVCDILLTVGHCVHSWPHPQGRIGVFHSAQSCGNCLLP